MALLCLCFRLLTLFQAGGTSCTNLLLWLWTWRGRELTECGHSLNEVGAGVAVLHGEVDELGQFKAGGIK